ncbi:UbiA prenyltransferase family, partial [Nemania sp. FL0916]
YNDAADARFDRLVARSRHRPVARGAVSPNRAYLFALFQLTLVLYPFTQLCFPPECLPHMVIMVLLFGLYALTKRVSDFPQVVLGVAFAWAVLFCGAAMDIEIFTHEGKGKEMGNGNGKATLALFTANVLWTIIYDTVYAHQDIADDAAVGVKSMSLRFRRSTKLLSSILGALQVLLLALCGFWAGFGALYFLGTVCGVGLALAYFIYDVELNSPASCGKWFRDQFGIVGGMFVLGLLGEYVMKLKGL